MIQLRHDDRTLIMSFSIQVTSPLAAAGRKETLRSPGLLSDTFVRNLQDSAARTTVIQRVVSNFGRECCEVS